MSCTWNGREAIKGDRMRSKYFEMGSVEQLQAETTRWPGLYDGGSMGCSDGEESGRG